MFNNTIRLKAPQMFLIAAVPVFLRKWAESVGGDRDVQIEALELSVVKLKCGSGDAGTVTYVYDKVKGLMRCNGLPVTFSFLVENLPPAARCFDATFKILGLNRNIESNLSGTVRHLKSGAWKVEDPRYKLAGDLDESKAAFAHT